MPYTPLLTKTTLMRSPRAAAWTISPVPIAARSPSPWYVKTLALSQPLHFGDYGGLPLKILWGLLDLFTVVVLGSGLYLWLAKRRPARASAPATAPVLAPAE